MKGLNLLYEVGDIMTIAVKVENYSFAYKKIKVLKNISFQVPKGSCFGILGANGSGKTTLINSIIGMFPINNEIQIFNQTPNIKDTNFKKKIGIILDNDILIDYLSLEEYLFYIGKIYDLDDTTLQNRINKWLNYFHLENDKYRLLKFFSYGMRRKVQIISGLLHNPDIIIIDEPTNGLDVEMIYQLKKIIKILKNEKVTIILSTHYMSFAEEICDEICILSHGYILENDSPEVLKKKYVISTLEDLYIRLLEVHIDEKK